MATTSPYTQNNYQAVSTYRPYELPINDIFKANKTLNEFWDAGALKVKQAYESALGLDLTLNSNRELHKQFMQDAEKQISKLSSGNLGDPEVQRQGFAIFKPLVQNRLINMDDQLTKIRSNIINSAEGYKRRKMSDDGPEGEGYSETNLRYALDGFEGFNSNTNPEELENLFGKLRDKKYTPYYNYNKEFRDVMKDCKGPTTQVSQTLGNYINTTTQSGASDERLRECLTTSLSEMARNQMNIEGVMKFKNRDGSVNYQALADTYTSRFTIESQGLKEQSDKTSARLIALEQEYNKNPTEDLKKEIAFEKKLLEATENRYKNLVDSFDKLKIGDMDYLQRNYEGLASGIYYSSVIDGFSQAFRNDVTKNKLEADAVAMQRDRLAATQAEKILDRQHDFSILEKEHEYAKEIEYIKLGKKKNGDSADDLPINPASTNDNLVTDGQDRLFTEVKQVKSAALGLTTEFYNGNVKEDWEAAGKKKEDFYNPQTGELTSAALQYLKDKNIMNSDEVKAYYNSLGPLNARLKVVEAIIDAVDSDEEANNYSKDWRTQLGDQTEFKPITLSDGTQISALDIQDALEGRNGRFKIVKEAGSYNSTPSFGPLLVGAGYESGYQQYYIDGKRITQADYVNSGLNKLLTRVRSGSFETTTKAANRRNTLFNEAYLESEGRVQGTSLNNDKDNATRKSVYNAVTRAGAVGIDLDQVQVVSYSPRTGRATLQIVKKNKESQLPSPEEVRARLEEIGQTDKTFVKSGGDAITIDIYDKDLISKDHKNNPYTSIQGSLGSLERIIKKTKKYEPGERIRERQIVLSSPVDKTTSFRVVPYKTSSGDVLYQIEKEYQGENTETRKKGDFVKWQDGKTLTQVISIINTN